MIIPSPHLTLCFFKLEILKIQDLFKVKIDKFIYKCLNNNTPINFWFLYTTQIHNYNTRSEYIDTNQLIITKNLFIPAARTSHYGLKKIKVHGPKIWNELPSDVRVITSFGLFKVNLNRHMVNNYKSNI